MPPLQYVILRHEGTDAPHYDLMFETLPGSGLATWRSAQWLIDGPTEVTRLKEHRRIFLSYEGDLTGHRGHVFQLARGECTIEIGENAVWTIRFLTGMIPWTLSLRQVQGEQWEASPVALP